jgi:hypothetical protein
MNSEVVRNYKLQIKDFHQGKKIVKQYIFTCSNCGQEISMPDRAEISGTALKRDPAGLVMFTTNDALSCHLMTCEKYNPNSGPATSV